MEKHILITLREAKKLLSMKSESVSVSLDLNKSQTSVARVGETFVLGGEKITKKQLEKVKENTIYLVSDNALKPLALFSPESNFYYKLRPTPDWPTLTLSSTPMHRHTHVTPLRDTSLKIKEISPVRGRVLDTCCGLGYTAIMAAHNASSVDVFERDKYVIALAKYNPYSSDLFTDKRITLHVEDVKKGIVCFGDGYFDRVIHDPPTFAFSPELYSVAFYKELFRVMKKGGVMYHYAPAPHKTKGKDFQASIVAKLKEVGFTQVEYHAVSSGVRAVR